MPATIPAGNRATVGSSLGGGADRDFHRVRGYTQFIADAAAVFFRFAGCPACNIALPYYDEHLAPQLAALGASLVGVSPQVRQKLRTIKERHALSFRIATDEGNALARRFGVTYEFDEPTRFPWRPALRSATLPVREHGNCPCRRSW